MISEIQELQPTQLQYMDQPPLLTGEAKIIKCDQDDRGTYIVLDRTLFHPQGGGQPSDKGTVRIDSVDHPVIHVKIEAQVVYHYLESSIDSLRSLPSLTSVEMQPIEMRPIEMRIDTEYRSLCSKLHTAGHWVSHVLTVADPSLKAVKGHHFPNECYIEAIGSLNPESNLLERLNALLKDSFEGDIPVVISKNDGLRTVMMGNHLPVGCGGTHVSSLKEIGPIRVSKVKIKKDRVKISYELS